MIDLSHCTQLGFLSKTHGVNGKIVLRLNNFNSEDIEKMEWVFLILEGLPVPFFVDEYTIRDKDTILLKLEDIDNVDQVKQYVASKVYIKTNCLSASENHLHKFQNYMSYNVIDKTIGLIGELIEVIDIQDNPIMSVRKEGREIMIPLQNEFIQSVDVKSKSIFVNIPEGLTEI